MEEMNKKEHWPELYRKALFEEDRNKLPLLLEQAHQAIQKRVRELWYSPNPGQNVTDKERRELHAAAYYLGLLRSLEAGTPLEKTDCSGHGHKLRETAELRNIDGNEFN